MKTKVLPALWYCTAYAESLRTGFITAKLRLHPVIAIAGAWLASILAALLAGRAVLRLKPDLRFSTRVQIDGLGYVHEGGGVVFLMTLQALVVYGALLIFKR